MSKTWNVTVNGTEHRLELDDKCKVSINGATPVLVTKFKKKSHILETEYNIPLGNQTAVLHLPSGKGKEPVLTINNRDCITGAEYEVEKAPAWGWAFAVLYVINFLFIMGGALGGGVGVGFTLVSLNIAANKKKSIPARVMTGIGVYVAVTVVSLIINLGIAAMLGY